jgi:AraC-like DNA-binding protein
VLPNPATRVPELPPPPTLVELVAGFAKREGCTDALFPGLRFFRCTMRSTFEKTQAPGPVLTVVAQGRKTVRWEGQELVYDPSRYFVLTGEGTFAGCVTEASAGRPYLAVCLSIPPDLIAKTLLALADGTPAAAEPGFPAYTAPLDSGMRDAVIRFLLAIDDPVERQVLAPLALEEIVFRLLRSDAAAAVRAAVGQSNDAAQIKKAMSFMRARATAPISVEDVARHVAMSPSHFAHRFRAVARVSPMRYLKQLRMDQARAVLLAGGARISEAAAQVGYESASHFTRDFKSTFGTAPAAYVRRFRSA